MSDLSYLHEKPVLVYGGTEAGDLFTIIDTSDGNRIKVVTQAELIKIILGGKTLGGTGGGDIVINSGLEETLAAALANYAEAGFAAGQTFAVSAEIPSGHGGTYAVAEATLLTKAGLSILQQADYAIDPLTVNVLVWTNLETILQPWIYDNDTQAMEIDLDAGAFNEISLYGLDDGAAYVVSVVFALKER